jgi:Bacterial HORMA domain 2
MSTSTFVISYVYTVTYVTSKMLHLLGNIIRDIGLDPSRFTKDWAVYEDGISTWLRSRHLKRVALEVYDPTTSGLVTRWDIEIVYSTVGDGSLWVDAAAVRYAIAKAGLAPSSCLYTIKVKLNDLPGKPTVPGWGDCSFRSTDGLRRYAVGATVGGNGLATETAYWSR